MFLPLWIGRRRSGELAGYVGAAFLVAMAAFNSGFIDTVPVFLVLLMAMMFFFDGGLSNATPILPKCSPLSCWGRGTGAGPGMQRHRQDPWATGPGGDRRSEATSVTPKAASSEAILPAFLVLAGCAAAVWTLFHTGRRDPGRSRAKCLCRCTPTRMPRPSC